MKETLVPAGVKMPIDDPAREDFGAHRARSACCSETMAEPAS
jgi:hypothetical protein